MSCSVNLNIRPETLKDIESIDAEKNGFDREELKNGIPTDLPNSYKATNVHVFVSTPIKAPEWDNLLRNVPHATDVEKHMKALKENKSETVFTKNGGAESSRVTIFNLPTHPDFAGEEQRVLVATSNNSANGAEPTAEAKLVSLPVSALLSSSTAAAAAVAEGESQTTTTATPVAAPWNNAAICKDHSNDRFVMICSHVKRDPRCGMCGAILVDLLQIEIEKQLKEVAENAVGAFAGKVHVARCSHVGGHAHAGNVAVVSKDGGVMFGCVNPNDVPLLAKSLLSSQPVLQSLMSIDGLKAKVRGALLAGVRTPKF